MEIKKIIGMPLSLAGAGIGMGVIGQQINSPKLVEAGNVPAGFIKPTVSIATGSFLIKQLREINKEKGKTWKDKTI